MGTADIARVVVLEDNEALRLGIAALIRTRAGAQCEIAHAAQNLDDLVVDDVVQSDVVLVGGINVAVPEDHFAPVAAVQTLRARDTARFDPLVVVYADLWQHPALRLRAREAGANAVVSRHDVTDADGLARITRWQPESCPSISIGSSEELRALGITTRARINPFVERVRELGIDKHFAEEGAEALGSRRAVQRLRADLARVSRIDVINTDGFAPRRTQALPSIRQLRRVYRWATRIDPANTTDS